MASNGVMRTLVVIFAVMVAVAGCGTDDTPPTSAATTTGTPTGSADPSTTPPATQPPTTTSGPSLRVPSSLAPPPGREITLEGVVQAGVEAGCLLLDTGGTQYLLLGGDRTVLRAGQRVVVRGQTEAGVVTICQQGTPFVVAEARPG